MYNDSAFGEYLAIDDTTPDAVTLTVPSSERHDGTAGTGARFVNGTNQFVRITITMDLEWFELDIQGNGGSGYAIHAGNMPDVAGTTITNLLVHDVGGGRPGIVIGWQPGTIQNCIVYNTDAQSYSANGNSAGQIILNCTSHSVGSLGFSFGDNAGTVLRNCISTDATGDDFRFASPSFAVVSNNLSSDTTASGTGSLISKTSANQYVSSVSGAEDLHLKAGADAIGAGTDLGTTDGVNIDINGLDRDAATSIVWDMGAHQYRVTTSIGTTARDYTTITLWEAAIGGTAGGAGSDVVGEMYNDSVFDEGFTLDDTTPDAIKLTVASGEEHDGTAGTGARVVATGDYTFTASTGLTNYVEWLEIDLNGSSTEAFNSGSADRSKINRLIVHGVEHNGWLRQFKNVRSLSNTIVYNTHCTVTWGAGTYGINLSKYGQVKNCTVWNTTKASGGGSVGIRSDDRYVTIETTAVQNCISVNTGAGSTDFNFTNNYSAPLTHEYNMSADSSADGTGSITGVSEITQFVSTVNGSEDLHLKAGSDAIGVATDLGTTNDVNIDINGLDRDASTSTVWDMGAHQYRVTTSIGTTARDYSTITLWEAALGEAAGGTGNAAVGECYNDSTFTEAVSISDSAPDSILVTAPAAERHDGTEGTGVRNIAPSLTTAFAVSGNCPTILEWIGCSSPNSNAYAPVINIATGSTLRTVQNLLIYDSPGPGYSPTTGILCYYAVVLVQNTIIYDCGASGIASLEAISDFFNVTIVNTGNGFKFSDSVYNSDVNIKNCIVMDSSISTDFQHASPSNVTVSNNMSSDTSASGTDSLVSKTSFDQFVSNVSGSEDLHLKTGADALRAGVDLGTTNGVNIDIDGRDRDSNDDTWDMGADQCESCATGSAGPNLMLLGVG
jgi:hypothetical protein